MVAESKPLFPLGRTVATPGALEELERAGQSPAELLRRHESGGWGDLDEHDKQANEDALKHGDRILSAYVLNTGVKLWIITEAADESGRREATTILLPSEY